MTESGLGPPAIERDVPAFAQQDHNKDPLRRPSSGLRHFLAALPENGSLQILDLGGLSESNVSFLSGMGCKIHALDLLALFDAFRSSMPGRDLSHGDGAAFIEEYLGFPPENFDAILAWDVLEYLDAEVLDLAVSRLGQILRPSGSLLTFFHNQSRGELVTLNQYQIENGETLRLRQLRRRPLPHTFNNRSLERLFSGFTSVKFFLTRDSIREVIAIR